MPTASVMPTTYATPADNPVLHSVQTTLKLTYGLVPIAAGMDKFTHLLTDWTQYLNPLALELLPVTAATFMRVVGVIEIIAGVLVLVRPRLGAAVVGGWLLAIALQLLAGWMFVDIAVRDVVMAVGAFALVRLSGLTSSPSAAPAHPRDRADNR